MSVYWQGSDPRVLLEKKSCRVDLVAGDIACSYLVLCANYIDDSFLDDFSEVVFAFGQLVYDLFVEDFIAFWVQEDALKFSIWNALYSNCEIA